jgi:hypothetical protein
MSDVTKRSRQISVTVLPSIDNVKRKQRFRRYHKERHQFVAGVTQLWSRVVVYVVKTLKKKKAR